MNAEWWIEPASLQQPVTASTRTSAATRDKTDETAASVDLPAGVTTEDFAHSLAIDNNLPVIMSDSCAGCSGPTQRESDTATENRMTLMSVA